MNVFDRIIMVIYTFCLAIFSIVLILIPFDKVDFLSESNIMSYIQYSRGNYVYSVVGLAFLLVSMRFFVLAVRGKKKNSGETYIIKHTDYGEVKISSQTFIGLVESVANKFSGIRSIKPGVNIVEGILTIVIKGEVAPEINIPETSVELQNKVKEHVEGCTGVEVSEVKVEINNVIAPTRDVK